MPLVDNAKKMDKTECNHFSLSRFMTQFRLTNCAFIVDCLATRQRTGITHIRQYFNAFHINNNWNFELLFSFVFSIELFFSSFSKVFFGEVLSDKIRQQISLCIWQWMELNKNAMEMAFIDNICYYLRQSIWLRASIFGWNLSWMRLSECMRRFHCEVFRFSYTFVVLWAKNIYV